MLYSQCSLSPSGAEKRFFHLPRYNNRVLQSDHVPSPTDGWPAAAGNGARRLVTTTRTPRELELDLVVSRSAAALVNAARQRSGKLMHRRRAKACADAAAAPGLRCTARAPPTERVSVARHRIGRGPTCLPDFYFVKPLRTIRNT